MGIIGAFLGGFIMNQFGETGVTRWNWRRFLVAVGGAVVLLVILALIRGRGRRRSS
ncbi:MAG: GlsB/YeaQ/YmgE family stress response membrane protein [Thermoleophilia bacterium]|nr:GlsB/YeaQ/YmgE family stress response membrane protein [Thermoleophilia bacterium]